VPARAGEGGGGCSGGVLRDVAGEGEAEGGGKTEGAVAEGGGGGSAGGRVAGRGGGAAGVAVAGGA